MKTTKAIVNASYSSIFPAQVIDHYQASRVGHRSIMFQIFPSRPKVAYKYLCSLPSAQPDTRLFQPSSIGIPQIRSIVPLRRSAMFDKHKSNHRAGLGCWPWNDGSLSVQISLRFHGKSTTNSSWNVFRAGRALSRRAGAQKRVERERVVSLLGFFEHRIRKVRR